MVKILKLEGKSMDESKNLASEIMSSMKKIENAQKELFGFANTLWGAIPYGTEIDVSDEGMLDNDGNLIIRFINDGMDGCLVKTEKYEYIEVRELDTPTYCHLADTLARMIIEK